MPTPPRQVRSLMAEDSSNLSSYQGSTQLPASSVSESSAVPAAAALVDILATSEAPLGPTRIIGLTAEDSDYDSEDFLPPALTTAVTSSDRAFLAPALGSVDRVPRGAVFTNPDYDDTEAPPPTASELEHQQQHYQYQQPVEDYSLDQSWLSVPPPPPLPIEEEEESSHNIPTETMMEGTPHWDQSSFDFERSHKSLDRKKIMLFGIAVLLLIVAAVVSVPVALFQGSNNSSSNTSKEIASSTDGVISSAESTEQATPTVQGNPKQQAPPLPTLSPAVRRPPTAETVAPTTKRNAVHGAPTAAAAAGQTEDATAAPKPSSTLRTETPNTINPPVGRATKNSTAVAPVTNTTNSTIPIDTDSELVQRLLQVLPSQYQTNLNSKAIAWLQKQQQQTTSTNNHTNTNNSSSTTIPTSSLSDAALVQRYAMAVLDVTWGSWHRALSPKECEWNGVTCDNATTSTTDDDNHHHQLVRSVKWPSQQLTGTLPSELALLTHLTQLDVAQNSIGGPIPEALYNLSKLEYLYLFENKITGTLSERVADWTQLNKMFLGNNLLTGTLPQGLGSPGSGSQNVRPMTWLSLSNNRFIGTIPTDWNLRKLYYLDLGKNELTGTVPLDWTTGRDNMDGLKILYLDHNRLTGELPSNFITDTGNGRLQSLIVNDNLFTGEFPGENTVQNAMDIVEFQHNNFTSMNTDLCSLIVFSMGEMISLRADCEVCRCKWFCDTCY